ncbi:MAG: hypothetical protein GF353_01605 [Candidatus Lokiarchaeota archaeon]|nr:hypothetical protein [Candidatus Lokiarchaeota archaeon]
MRSNVNSSTLKSVNRNDPSISSTPMTGNTPPFFKIVIRSSFSSPPSFEKLSNQRACEKYSSPIFPLKRRTISSIPVQLF